MTKEYMVCKNCSKFVVDQRKCSALPVWRTISDPENHHCGLGQWLTWDQRWRETVALGWGEWETKQGV